MSAFVCRVVDAKGKRSTFSREAAHKAAILRDLNQEGFFILSVEPASASAGAGKRALKPATILEFTQVLATLMGNGLPLKEALTVARKLGGKTAGALFKRVEERVSKGDSLFDSLSGAGLSPLYLGLVRVGERSGDLGTIFQRLADYLAGRKALRDKLVNSMVYPLFVLGVAIVGIALLSFLILPKLTGMIGSMNPDAATLYMRNLAGFRTGIGVLGALVAALAAGGAAAIYYRGRSASWASRFDAFLLRVPIASIFYRSSFGLNFSFAMETLLASGYPLEDALAESSWVVGNRRFREGILAAKDRVEKGALLSESLIAEKVFPEVLTGWMAVGEGANDLVRSFAQVRAYYQKETDKLYSRFMNLAEPSLIAIVGLVLISLILTFITPIFTMLGNLI